METSRSTFHEECVDFRKKQKFKLHIHLHVFHERGRNKAGAQSDKARGGDKERIVRIEENKRIDCSSREGVDDWPGGAPARERRQTRDLRMRARDSATFVTAEQAREAPYILYPRAALPPGLAAYKSGKSSAV